MKIEIDKQKELVAVLDKNDIAIEEKDKIINLMNKLELFANIDSGKVTDGYIKENSIILEKLIEIGVKDLHYNISVIAGKDRFHSFVKDSIVNYPIVKW